MDLSISLIPNTTYTAAPSSRLGLSLRLSQRPAAHGSYPSGSTDPGFTVGFGGVTGDGGAGGGASVAGGVGAGAARDETQ